MQTGKYTMYEISIVIHPVLVVKVVGWRDTYRSPFPRTPLVTKAASGTLIASQESNATQPATLRISD